jgi:hypothetical protein
MLPACTCFLPFWYAGDDGRNLLPFAPAPTSALEEPRQGPSWA